MVFSDFSGSINCRQTGETQISLQTIPVFPVSTCYIYLYSCHGSDSISTPIHTNNPHTNFGLIPEACSGALDGFPTKCSLSKCTSTNLYTICLQLGTSTLTTSTCHGKLIYPCVFLSFFTKGCKFFYLSFCSLDDISVLKLGLSLWGRNWLIGEQLFSF